MPLVEGREAGWPVWMVAALALSPLAFASFFWWERDRSRRGRAPLLNIALFGQPAFSVGLGITLAFFSANAGFAFVFALFL